MHTNNSPTAPAAQNDTGQLQDLLYQSKKINKEIEETGKQSEKDLDKIEKNVDKAVEKIEDICADLDKLEEKTGDELDKIMLEEAKDLAD